MNKENDGISKSIYCFHQVDKVVNPWQLFSLKNRDIFEDGC